MLSPITNKLLLVAGLILVLLTLSLMLELMIVIAGYVLPARSNRGKREGSLPLRKLAILVPAHNEALLIRDCVRSLLASIQESSKSSDVEVYPVVIAHNCDDETETLATQEGAYVLRLNDSTLNSKGDALQAGLRYALQERDADAVMVVDADSTITLPTVGEICKSLKTESVVQCCYKFTANNSEGEFRLRALAFNCMNSIRPTARNRMGLSVGILGNGFAIRREVFDEVPYGAKSLVEDLEFHMALLIKNKKVSLVEKGLVLCDPPPTKNAAATQSARWEGGRLHIMNKYAPKLLGKILEGNLRLIEPLFDLMGLSMAFHVTLLFLLLLLPFWYLRIYSLLGFALVFAYVAFGVRDNADIKKDLQALMEVPFYVFKKLLLLPKILRMASRKAIWVRTSRQK